MRFESVKGSYNGYEYDMREQRYKPVFYKSKKKIGIIAVLVTIFILCVVLINRQPSSSPGSDSKDWFKPDTGASYYHQETGDIKMDEDVSIYSIPLFSGELIKQLQSKGKKVLCQYSVGVWRQGQPALDKKYMGNEIQSNVFALNVKEDAVKNYVSQFIQKAEDFGCDGFEPLDMNVYSRDNGLDITLDDQFSYSKWLADQAHSKGLFIGMYNAVLQLAAIDSFDYAVAINCFMTNNCVNYSQVISKAKPVFDMETTLKTDAFCEKANSLNFYAITKPSDFGPGAEYCKK
eukprot:NODE_51_length_31136_cov_0.357670.p12 type:complete len:290 gc:universal NODE_51_length_31136_cov_0.357670:18418-17549(-)